LSFEKIPAQKVHVGVGTNKRYIPQVTISDDSMWESKRKGNPSPTLRCPWTRDSMSFGLEEAHEVDEAMRWVLEQGRVCRVVAKKDAFNDTLKHIQARLLVSKKEVAKLEGTQVHHFANYIELSQKVKTTELLLSTTNQAKSILDNRVQTLERELVQRGVELEGVWQVLEKE
jgi:hypothetical protein